MSSNTNINIFYKIIRINIYFFMFFNYIYIFFIYNDYYCIHLTSHIKKEFIKDKLFPYKYYLCSVFIKNLDISKKNCLFSSQFSKIYIFLCQLFDITTYLSLQKEFNSLKKIFNEKSINLIEKNKKININSNNFIKDINDCIGEHKFHILAQGFKN